MKFFNKAFILFLALLFWYLPVQANENRAGTNAASELLIPVGAQYIAMSGASVAGVTGLESIYWNPAGLDHIDHSAAAMFSHMAYFADISVSYLAVAAKFSGIGTLGLSFKTLGFGDIPITTEDDPDGTGAQFSPQFMNIGLSYSRTLTDRVAVGTTVKLINETIDRVSATGFAFDAGVQYSGLANVNGLKIGVTLKHLGPGIKFDGNGLNREAQPTDISRPPSYYKVIAGTDELPAIMEIGIGYSFDLNNKNKLHFESVFVNHNYQDDGACLGAEYSFSDLFFLRGGYGHALNSGDDPTGASTNIFGLSLGAGFQYNLGGFDLAIDYAFRDVDYFNANNVFTIKFGF